MINWYASRTISRVLGGGALGLSLLLAACGADSGESTPTPTETEVVKPTTPGVVADATSIATVASSAVSTPDSKATATGNPAMSTPASQATVAIPATNEGTPEPTAVASSPEPTVASPAANTESDSPGDGTGGSGMPGERSSNESPEATPSAAGTPVAELSVEGCELPDVPAFSGSVSEVQLTSDVNFRSGPGVDCEPLLDEPLGQGQTVTITGGPVTQLSDGSEWIEIEFNGTRGWISAEFIEPAE